MKNKKQTKTKTKPKTPQSQNSSVQGLEGKAKENWGLPIEIGCCLVAREESLLQHSRPLPRDEAEAGRLTGTGRRCGPLCFCVCFYHVFLLMSLLIDRS